MTKRHVVVTGAGTGIGRAIAVKLASSDTQLSLLARDVGRLEQTAQLVRAAGAEVLVAGCDIRERASIDAAFDGAADTFGPIHSLVANSGIGGPNDAGDAGDAGHEDRFDELVLTNLSGTYLCLRAAQRLLAPGPGPRQLVVISSILARIGVPGYTGYCASKAGLLGLVRALAAELAPDNVMVNAVCPGWVNTAMAHEGLEGMAAAMGVTKDEAHGIAMQAVPLGRMGEPEEIAGLVRWLLSADSVGVTGQGLDMNGGAFMS